MSCSCIIIEDQPPAQRILQRYVAELSELELKGTFADPLQALEQLKTDPVDLIFLDIHLPRISGLDFLRILPYKPRVILTTAFSEYALEGYEYDVVDYLLKPISFERFLKAVSKVIYQREQFQSGAAPTATEPEAEQHIFVKSDRSIVKLEFEKIIFIKAEDDYTRVFYQPKNYFLSYTLKYWEEVLPREQFQRIHKSFILNLSYIEKIAGGEVFIKDHRLPIGRSYRNAFFDRIDLKE